MAREAKPLGKGSQDKGFESSSIHEIRMCILKVFCVDYPIFLSGGFPMSQLRVVVLTAVAFVAAGFGSVAMAGCGGDNGCGGARGGLLSRLHSKKAACSGAVAKDCSGGGMLSKLGSRRSAKCSGAAVSNCAPAPAPAPACNTGCNTGCGTVESGCGCGSAAVSSGCSGCGTVTSEPVMVGSAPCTNCSGTVNAGTVESSSVAPPTPAASNVPAAPAAPAVPAAPAAPASASDVPKA